MSRSWHCCSKNCSNTLLNVHLFPAHQAGIQALLDFVDDDVPFYLKHEEAGRTLCLPYCMDPWRRCSQSWSEAVR